MICTHNPRIEYLNKTLEGIRAQTTPVGDSELVIVDNASDAPVAGRIDLSWHPAARCVREDRKGLVYARLRGFRETVGELIIGSDDDNVLASDYIAQALRIARDWPMLGVWGGHIDAVFEVPPPAWAVPYLHHLAVRRIAAPRWSSFVIDHTMPYGAGQCIRRSVVDGYLKIAAREKTLACFNRRSNGAGDGDDAYLCYVAHELGFGEGVFPELKLQHLIPKERFNEDYFVRIARGNAHVAMLLQLRGNGGRNLRRGMALAGFRFLAAGIVYHGMKRRICCAQARGEIAASLEYQRALQPET
jgi:glycosyltransferase involved in cell wall biosynthesis